jgi:hypothetical protein
MKQRHDRDHQQVDTVPVSHAWIMRRPEFALGVNDARVGRPLRSDYDNWDTNRQWNYERGRAFATLAPRHMLLRIDGKLNPAALALFIRAYPAIL